MSDSLGRLELGLGVDLPGLESALVAADRSIEKYKAKWQSLQNSVPIRPIVDDSQLTALNKHLSLKQAHLAQVRADFAKPLMVKADYTSLDEYSRKLDKLQQPRRDISVNGRSTQIKTDVDGDGLSRSIQSAIEKGMKASNPSSILASISRGAFENIGKNLQTSLTGFVGNQISQLTSGTIGSPKLILDKLSKASTQKIQTSVVKAREQFPVVDEFIKSASGEIRGFVGERDIAVEANKGRGTSDRTKKKDLKLAQEGVVVERQAAIANYQEKKAALDYIESQRSQVNQQLIDLAPREEKNQKYVDERRAIEKERLEKARQAQLAKLESRRAGASDPILASINRKVDRVGRAPLASRKLRQLDESETSIYAPRELLGQKLDYLDTQAKSRKIDFRVARERAEVAKRQSDALQRQQQPAAYQDILDEIAPGLDPSLVPKLKSDQSLGKTEGTRGAYNAASNTISLNPDTYKAVQSGKPLSKIDRDILFEEAQHSSDFRFGRFEGVQAVNEKRLIDPKIKATPVEELAIENELRLYDKSVRPIERQAKIKRDRSQKKYVEQQTLEKITEVAGGSGVDYFKSTNKDLSDIGKTSNLIAGIANTKNLDIPSLGRIQEKQQLLTTERNNLLAKIQSAQAGDIDGGEFKKIELELDKNLQQIQSLKSRSKALGSKIPDLISAPPRSKSSPAAQEIAITPEIVKAPLVERLGQSLKGSIGYAQKIGSTAQKVGAPVAQFLRNSYDALQGVENAVLPIVPFGQQIKSVGKNVALPAAIYGGIGLLPGGAAAQSAVGGAMNGLLSLPSAGIAEAVAGSVGSAFGSVPLIGPALSSGAGTLATVGMEAFAAALTPILAGKVALQLADRGAKLALPSKKSELDYVSAGQQVATKALSAAQNLVQVDYEPLPSESPALPGVPNKKQLKGASANAQKLQLTSTGELSPIVEAMPVNDDWKATARQGIVSTRRKLDAAIKNGSKQVAAELFEKFGRQVDEFQRFIDPNVIGQSDSATNKGVVGNWRKVQADRAKKIEQIIEVPNFSDDSLKSLSVDTRKPKYYNPQPFQSGSTNADANLLGEDGQLASLSPFQRRNKRRKPFFRRETASEQASRESANKLDELEESFNSASSNFEEVQSSESLLKVRNRRKKAEEVRKQNFESDKRSQQRSINVAAGAGNEINDQFGNFGRTSKKIGQQLNEFDRIELESGTTRPANQFGEAEERIRRSARRFNRAARQIPGFYGGDGGGNDGDGLNLDEIPRFGVGSAGDKEKIIESINPLQSLGGAAKTAGGAFFAFQGLKFVGGLLSSWGAGAAQTAIAFDNLSIAAKAVSSSDSTAARSIGSSRALANKLGFNPLDVTQSVQGFKSATLGTDLEGIGDATVANTTKYARLVGLNPQSLSGVQRQVIQLAGKANATQEDIGQAEENLPGFSALLARGLGTTVTGLRKQTNAGTLSGVDAIQALNVGLSSATSGSQMDEALNSTSAALGRTQGAMTNLQKAVGDGLLAPLATGAKLAGGALDGISANAETFATVFIAVMAAAGAAGLVFAGKMAMAAAGVVNFGGAMLAVAPAIGQFALLTGGIYLAIEAFKTLNASAEPSAFKKYADEAGKLSGRLSDLKDQSDKTNDSLKSPARKAQEEKFLPKRTFFESWGDLFQSESEKSTSNLFQGKVPDKFKDKKPDFVARKQQQELLEVEIAQSDLGSALKKPLGKEKVGTEIDPYAIGRQKAEIDRKLIVLRQEQSLLPASDRAGTTRVQKEIQGLITDSTELTEPLTTQLAIIQNQKKGQQEITDSGTYADNPKILAQAQNYIQLLGNRANELEKVISTVRDGLTDLDLAIKRSSGNLGASLNQLKDTRTTRETSINKNASLNPLEAGALATQLYASLQKDILDRQKVTKKAVGENEGFLRDPILKKQVELYQKSGDLPKDIRNTSDEQLANIKSLGAKDDLAGRIKASRDLNDQLKSQDAEAASSTREYQQAVAENARSIRDYNQSLLYQAQRTSIDVKASENSIKNQGFNQRLQTALSGAADEFSSYFNTWIEIINESGKELDIESQRQKAQSQRNENATKARQDNEQRRQQARTDDSGVSFPPETTGASGGDNPGAVVSPLSGASLSQVIGYKPRREGINNQAFDSKRRRRSGWEDHGGIDYDRRAAGGLGATVQAPISGVVSEYDSGKSSSGKSMGRIVAIKGVDAKGVPTTARLVHVKSSVKSGDRVKAGQPVGSVVENHTGSDPHLHFDMSQNGRKMDPQKFFRENDEYQRKRGAVGTPSVGEATDGLVRQPSQSKRVATPIKPVTAEFYQQRGYQSSILQDLQTGKVVSEYNSQVQPASSASTLKLLVAQMVRYKANAKTLNLSDKVTIDPSIVATGDKAMAGKTFDIASLLKLSLRDSNNTASNALIKSLGGVDTVNAGFKSLGYTGSKLGNYFSLPGATGFKNKTTAKDLNAGLIDVSNSADPSAKIINQSLATSPNKFGYKGEQGGKIGNNSQSLGNTGIVTLNGRKYALSQFYNTPDSPQARRKLVKNTNELENRLGANLDPTPSIDPTPVPALTRKRTRKTEPTATPTKDRVDYDRGLRAVIAMGETPNPLSAKSYYYKYGGSNFSPEEASRGFPTSAGDKPAGRYQFHRVDYEEAAKRDPSIRDFSPASQDKIQKMRLRNPAARGGDKGYTANEQFKQDPSFKNFVTLRQALGAEYESKRDGMIKYDRNSTNVNFLAKQGLTDRELYDLYLRESGLKPGASTPAISSTDPNRTRLTPNSSGKTQRKVLDESEVTIIQNDEKDRTLIDSKAEQDKREARSKVVGLTRKAQKQKIDIKRQSNDRLTGSYNAISDSNLATGYATPGNLDRREQFADDRKTFERNLGITRRLEDDKRTLGAVQLAREETSAQIANKPQFNASTPLQQQNLLKLQKEQEYQINELKRRIAKDEFFLAKSKQAGVDAKKDTAIKSADRVQALNTSTDVNTIGSEIAIREEKLKEVETYQKFNLFDNSQGDPLEIKKEISILRIRQNNLSKRQELIEKKRVANPANKAKIDAQSRNLEDSEARSIANTTDEYNTGIFERDFAERRTVFDRKKFGTDTRLSADSSLGALARAQGRQRDAELIDDTTAKQRNRSEYEKAIQEQVEIKQRAPNDPKVAEAFATNVQQLYRKLQTDNTAIDAGRFTRDRERDFTQGTQLVGSRSALLSVGGQRAEAAGNTFDAKKLNYQAAVVGQNQEFRSKTKELEDLQRAGVLTVEQFQNLNTELIKLNEIKLDSLARQFDPMTDAIKTVSTAATTLSDTVLEGLTGSVKGSAANIDKAFKDLLASPFRAIQAEANKLINSYINQKISDLFKPLLTKITPVDPGKVAEVGGSRKDFQSTSQALPIAQSSAVVTPPPPPPEAPKAEALPAPAPIPSPSPEVNGLPAIPPRPDFTGRIIKISPEIPTTAPGSIDLPRYPRSSAQFPPIGSTTPQENLILDGNQIVDRRKLPEYKQAKIPSLGNTRYGLSSELPIDRFQDRSITPSQPTTNNPVPVTVIGSGDLGVSKASETIPIPPYGFRDAPLPLIPDILPEQTPIPFGFTGADGNPVPVSLVSDLTPEKPVNVTVEGGGIGGGVAGGDFGGKLTKGLGAAVLGAAGSAGSKGGFNPMSILTGLISGFFADGGIAGDRPSIPVLLPAYADGGIMGDDPMIPVMLPAYKMGGVMGDDDTLDIPAYAFGGVQGRPTRFQQGIVPGYSSKDDTLAIIMKGEAILNKPATAKFGRDGIDDLNKGKMPKIFQQEIDRSLMMNMANIPRYEDGGIQGGMPSISGAASSSFTNSLSNTTRFGDSNSYNFTMNNNGESKGDVGKTTQARDFVRSEVMDLISRLKRQGYIN